MTRKSTRGCFAPKLIAVAVASCFVGSTALANPTAPTVVSGTAAFNQSGNLLQITNSPNAIINWQSFSIGANEITRFLQQSAASAVLNRVIAQNPSSILGALQSNGRVFLINPNGILFGAGAQIDVAGLVASTLNLSNADFLAGRLNFTEVPGAGSVVNQGNITTGAGGQVYLVGPSVTNSGIITSPKGEVILAAGNSVELVNPGTPNLRVEISAPDNQAVNLGQIVADAGRVGIYAGLISQSGAIRADSAVAEGGRILLKATKSATLNDSSVLSAQGQGGGEIKVLAGENVQVAGRLDASAPNGGDGGFIETSAANIQIDARTVATTAAPQGKTGTWLIDPDDVCVGDTCTLLGPTNILWTTVTGVLLPAGNVVIATNPGGTGGNGDITVNDDSPDLASSNLFQLVAQRNVNVNGSITNSGGGTVALYAGWDGVSLAATPTVTPGTGNIAINAPISVTDAANNGRDATIKLTAGAAITVNNSLTATGGAGAESPGGSAFITLSAGTGITVDESMIRATGGNGGSGAAGGNATVMLASTGGLIDVKNSSIVDAFGGGGAGGNNNDPGGLGGNATVTLTGGSISITGSTIGAYAGAGGGGGIGSGFTYAAGGAGGNGGSAVVTLTGTNISVGGGSNISATGGNGGGGGSINAISSGAGGNGGAGGSATVTLTGSSSILVDGSNITVGGGNGGAGGSASNVGAGGNGGVGGAASVSLSGGSISLTSSSINVNEDGEGGAGGVGGYGNSAGGNGGVGGAASVSLSGGSISLTSSSINVNGGSGGGGGSGNSTGGNGGAGGAASASFTSTGGNITLTDSQINVSGGYGGNGGYGYSYGGAGGYGGAARVSLFGDGGGISLDSSSSINVNGGGGGGGGSSSSGGGPNGQGGGATVGLYAGNELIPAGSITLAGTVSATGGGSGSSQGIASVAITAGDGGGPGNISTDATITADGGEGLITMRAPQGFIRQSGSFGSLKATALSGPAAVINLVARDGVGELGNPIRIDNSGDPELFFQNTGTTTGDIAVSFFNNPTGTTCGGGPAVCIDGDMVGVFNNNPAGTYFIRAEDGLIQLDVPFKPGEFAEADLLPNQSVIFEAPSGDIVIGASGRIIAGAGGGSGNVSLTASGVLTLTSGAIVAGSDPRLKADDMDIQGQVLAGGGFVNILPFTTTRNIELGTSGSGSTVLALDNDELNRMTAWDGVTFPDPGTGGGGLIIGDDNGGSGNLVFTSLVDSSAFLNVRGVNITQQTGASITGGINVIAPGGVTLTESGNQINSITTGGGVGTGAIQLVTAVPLTVSGVTTTNANVNLQSSGDISLGSVNAGTGTVTLNSTGGAIVDNNSGVDIVATSANLAAATGIGSIANPIETQVSSISLSSAAAGEIGVINNGDLTLSSLTSGGTAAAIYASTQFGAASGTLSLGSPVSVSGSLSLLADTGMTVNNNVSAIGDLVLASLGDLNIRPSSGALNVSGNNVLLLGANVNVGSASSAYGTNIGANGALVVGAAGDFTARGGSGINAYVDLQGDAGAGIVTGGDVIVAGGSGSGSYSSVLGIPDVIMVVGGTVQISSGSGAGANAAIMARAPVTIYLDFPLLSSGGYFVNGVEGAIVDPTGTTGFFADGVPAVLGQNFLVTYSGLLAAPPPNFDSQLVSSLNDQSNGLFSGPPGGEGAGGTLEEDDEKKKLPICGAR